MAFWGELIGLNLNNYLNFCRLPHNLGRYEAVFLPHPGFRGRMGLYRWWDIWKFWCGWILKISEFFFQNLPVTDYQLCDGVKNCPNAEDESHSYCLFFRVVCHSCKFWVILFTSKIRQKYFGIFLQGTILHSTECGSRHVIKFKYLVN